MTKRPRKAAPKPVETTIETEMSATEVAESIFSESLRAILDEIRGIRAGKVDTAPHSPVTRIAWLAQRASSVQGELRKAEAARAKSSELAASALLDYFRKLAPAQRAQWVQDLTAMDRRGSVLG